ncbi:hypothetical protein HY501_02015 [Candidatus Woesearchaeota archaeon]|nr:hypothetical protein [Candidatus Woesearchaeota archaeon]
MATILELGLLDYFSPFFVGLLVYAILYALLEKTKIFGENKGTNAAISLALALLFLLTPDLFKLVKVITPWFTILFIFIVMIMLLFLFVGVSQSKFSEAFQDRGLIWIIIMICFIILFYGMTQVYGEQIHSIYAGEEGTAESSLSQNVGKIIFHPRVLGMVLILVLSAMAVRFISGVPGK